MRNRRRRGSAQASNALGSNILSLSVFIMLLAFFIILNAISQYEQTKVRPVMKSIGETFASRLADDATDENPSVAQSAVKSLDEGDTLERLKALFTAQIPGHKAVVSHRKGVMYVKVSFDEFEAAVLAVGQSEASNESAEGAKFLKGFFLPTLVALMRTEQAGTPYRMDMILNIGENPAALQNSQPQQLAATLKRMSRLADKIESAGLSPKLLSAGLQKGETGTVELLFRRHVPFDPKGGEDVRQ